MMTYMRTIIDLPEDQLRALDGVCRQERISRAEAIRRAVAEHLRRYHASDAKRAFGIWRGRQVDGLKYQETLRREWGRGWDQFDPTAHSPRRGGPR